MRKSLTFVAALAAPLVLAAAAAQARSFQRQVAADPHGEVDVSNVAGTIEIIGWDQPQVAVRAQLASDAQQVRVESEHGRTSIRVTGESHSWLGSGTRLEVHVPRGSEVDVSAVSADLTTRGVEGSQHLHTVSGEIKADLGSGDDEVKSVSGDIRLHGSGHPGHLRVTSVSGDVTLEDVAGDLEATTISGTLTAHLAPARRARLRTTSGDLRFNGRFEPGGTLEAETVSGDARIQAGAQAGYDYDVRTFSGDIDNCFGRQAERTSACGPGKRLDGALGAGNGRVRIRTLSGDVSLCDH
jgi:DUF4097 and DUF4098 domain-containing protein YvlB